MPRSNKKKRKTSTFIPPKPPWSITEGMRNSKVISIWSTFFPVEDVNTPTKYLSTTKSFPEQLTSSNPDGK